MALTYYNQATTPKVPQPQVATSGVPKNNVNTLYMQAPAQPAVTVPKVPSSTKTVPNITSSSAAAAAPIAALKGITDQPQQMQSEAQRQAAFNAAGLNQGQQQAVQAGQQYNPQQGTQSTTQPAPAATTTPNPPPATDSYTNQIVRGINFTQPVANEYAEKVFGLTGDRSGATQGTDGMWTFTPMAAKNAQNIANGVTTQGQSDTERIRNEQSALRVEDQSLQNTQNQSSQATLDFIAKKMAGQDPIPLSDSAKRQLAAMQEQQAMMSKIQIDSVNRYTQAAASQTSIGGTDQYAPQIALGYLNQIQGEGMYKVRLADVAANAAIAQLEQAFHSEDAKQVQAAWKQLDEATAARRTAISDTAAKGQAIVDKIQAAQQAKEAADLTKRIDLMKLLGESGAPPELLQRATSLPLVEAYAAAGPYLTNSLENQYKAAQIEGQYSDIDLNTARAKTEAAQQAKYYAERNKTLNEMQSDVSSGRVPASLSPLSNLVAGTGTTNAQRAALGADINSALANKDYDSAYAIVTQATNRALKGAAGSRFAEQVEGISVTKDLLTAINAYEAAGGSTNIFKGTADKIQSRIGALATDPRYAELAVQLDTAFQAYRQRLTGAAFGAQESREYASVLPSPGNTLALNRAKIAGALNYLESSVDASLKTVVGKTGPTIRKLSEGQQDNFDSWRGGMRQGEVLIMRNGEIMYATPDDINNETDIEL